MPIWYASAAATVSTTTTHWVIAYPSSATTGTFTIQSHLAGATYAYTGANTITYVGSDWIVYDEGRVPGILSAKTKRRMRREQREWTRMQEEANRAATQRMEERVRATTRARALLFSALSRDQQRSLEERNFFDMNVNGRTYRIHQGTHGNVRLIQGGVETRLYCAQPPDIPTEDAMLAQKLMLETDEPAFLRVANERILRAA